MPRKKETKDKTISTLIKSDEKTNQEKNINSREEKKSKPKIKALFSQGLIITENSNEARELYNLNRYGTLLEDGKVQLSQVEAFYLLEKEKLEIYDLKKIITKEDFLKKATKIDKNFIVRYSAYKDLRNRGYIVKTALKFGADFRVYDRGIKPGEDHAKWIVYPVKEDSSLTWYEFAAKNRVAHSTRKRLLLAVVDDELDISYWECRWLRP
ncbi:MAG: tRNA-intron lyase [Candidatus Woesearchaeota archaeon]